ncbi:hypothetical protein [Actinomadura sp. GTD37]|uniref:hypothetical protein n=1 Tax=Actinomadura sp. GTD37 TaxID=1778030 RepID=UPI0035C1231A
MPHLLMLAAAGALMLRAFTRGHHTAPIHTDGMPDSVHGPDSDDTTIGAWDRPDRAPGVHVRRHRPPKEDL